MQPHVLTASKRIVSSFRIGRILYCHTPLRPHTLLYRWKTGNKSVKNFYKHKYCITFSLSKLCKTYCFAFQKRRFCKVKAAVLHRKTAAFGKPKKNTRFSVKIFRYRSKGETVCANRRFLLATEATQGYVGASFITFLHLRCRPFRWLSVYYICR